MLKRFTVENYKGFKDKFIFDLSLVHEYKFNSEFVKNGVTNKGLIYGKNSSGKSNLGKAIMDITHHLTSNFISFDSGVYNNLYNKSNNVRFEYLFSFDGNDVLYKYERSSRNNLLNEYLYFNNELAMSFDLEKRECKVLLEESKSIDLAQYIIGSSIVAFVYVRGGFKRGSLFEKFMSFVNSMLLFKSLRNNEFEGRGRQETFADILLRHGNNAVKQLQDFLAENDINYELSIALNPLTGLNTIYTSYGDNIVPLETVWSTGTSALVLFYCWYIDFSRISFLYLDEFDAFYHYELSEAVLKLVNKNEHMQTLVTTHNTSLMNNKLTRPDCCFIIKDNESITNLSNCTERELRKAHNLENLYRNGAFI